MSKWATEWTGHYPCLCSGEWKLFKDGVEVPCFPPFNCNPANTLGVYESWHFDENYCEVFEDYVDGLDCVAWCEENAEWLATLTNKEEWPAIYEAFRTNDWRHGSCGGCI